ncbi:MAG TPA: peptidoglycan DD-metalloendopeptidase family protein [Candidatus Dormibacteraeota bacterium]|jgi:murein DD-endopeptidase MepM/ murein hydrolase activator NlpD|nr:peptidoglycan DD-metalloendopeptidase family protein [Candidatus Dormibacteraeota bacterium]
MRRLTALLLLAGSLAMTLGPAVPASADNLTDAQRQAQDLGGQITALKARVAQLQTEAGQVSAQLQSLASLIALQERNLAVENARLDEIMGGIADTQKRLTDKLAELARREDLLHQRTRNLYKEDGNTTVMISLLSASNFTQLIDRFMVFRDITRSDEVLVAQLQDGRRSIESLAASLDQKRKDQQAVVASVAAQRQELNREYISAAVLRHQLGAEVLDAQALAARAQAALDQVDAEIAALKEARKRAHSSGVFAWPGVQGPITQGFGCTDFRGEPPPPSGYSCPRSRPYFHTGIDIAGPYGAEIVAADGGIAYTYAGSSGYGNHVIVVHANGFTTLYGHMSSFAVGSGSPVAKGQAIGYEGSTGFSSGPHLHFEVRLNDAVQDPCRYVGC